jgi:7-keto-8-aminopelargonate synthetase-like enzyme
MLDDWIAPKLEDLGAREWLRVPFSFRDDILDFASNDYLGLARGSSHGRTGSGGSPHITGVRDCASSLVEELSDFLKLDAGVVFTSGYGANFGTIEALATLVDDVLSDELNHASIIDGCRLARHKAVQVFKHGSLDSLGQMLAGLRGRRVLVVIESYYSMDADSYDLQRVDALVREHGSAILMVDEAHAVGVFGGGRGLCSSSLVTPDILVCTFGKALGASGAFVGGTRALSSFLWNHCRPLIFSTGASPASIDVVRANLAQLRSGELVEKLNENARFFRTILAENGVRVLPASHGPIVPIQLADAVTAVACRERLLSHKFLIGAVRPPTIPSGGRLRIVIHADHSHGDMNRLCMLLTKEMAV